MTTFDRDYDFYKLSEDKRLSLVGSYFYAGGRETIYFPLQLTSDEKYYNYGVQQGVIFVTEVMKYKGKKWFRVGVFSPDDLDMDLDFQEPQCNLRGEIIHYLKRINKTNVTYEEILTKIQNKFGGILS